MSAAYHPPSYTDDRYFLSSDVLHTIGSLQRMPMWQRRKQFRQWESRVKPLIYKYADFNIEDALSVQKVRDLLVESKLYLAAPSQFNDPYDFTARFELPSDPVVRRKNFARWAKRAARQNPSLLRGLPKKAKIDRLVSDAMERSIRSPEMLTESFNKTRDTNGVACFSEDGRNLLMWAHYAAGHAGLCLQFDVVRDPGVLMVVHKVSYHDAPALLQWPQDRERVVEDVILRKGKVWDREQEVRYVSLTTVRDYLPFDGRALVGVLLGSRFPQESRAVIEQLLHERAKRGLPTPRLYAAERHLTRYQVKFRRDFARKDA